MTEGMVFVGECPCCMGDDIALVAVEGDIRGWCDECDTEYTTPSGDDVQPQPVPDDVRLMRVGNWRHVTREEAAGSQWRRMLGP